MVQSVKRDKKDRVLSIRDLNISFKTNYGVVNAIRGVRLDLFKGETIAIVGESGSGKSVTCKTIMGILDSNGIIDSGEITLFYKDENGNEKTADLTKMSQKQIRYEFCGRKIAMVFQDPMTSLDPTMTIAKQIMEPMIEHRHMTKEEARQHALDLLTKVGIENPEKRMKQYPHELSGGMRQRVVIAIALACEPNLIVADEPTTALDAAMQVRVIRLLKKIVKETNTALLLVSHNMGVIAAACDYVYVMKDGKMIENGCADDIFYNPQTEYTKKLLSDATAEQLLVKEKVFAAQENPLFTVRHLKKRFQNEEGVNDVSFDICEGEVFALAGESGSGKTTLAKILGTA